MYARKEGRAKHFWEGEMEKKLEKQIEEMRVRIEQLTTEGQRLLKEIEKFQKDVKKCIDSRKPPA